jgi:hypothetical protein
LQLGTQVQPSQRLRCTVLLGLQATTRHCQQKTSHQKITHLMTPQSLHQTPAIESIAPDINGVAFRG